MNKDALSKERLVFFGLVTTACSLIPTGYAAVVSNSTVLFTDLLRCLAEFLAIFVSWIVVRQVARHDISTYNFGFGKLEQLAGISVAAALFFGFLLSLVSSVHRFLSPELLTGSRFGMLFGFLSVVGNLCLWLLNAWSYKKSDYTSTIAESQSRLFRAKTAATGVVAVSLLIAELAVDQWWGGFVDPVGALLLAVFLLHSAYSMLSSSVPDLVDRAVDEKIQQIILQTLITHESKYAGLEAIRTRRAGATRMYIDIFLAFPKTHELGAVLDATSLIEKDIIVRIPGAHVTIVPVAA